MKFSIQMAIEFGAQCESSNKSTNISKLPNYQTRFLTEKSDSNTKIVITNL